MTIYLDPTSEQSRAQRPAAPRLDAIEGKRIGLLDISKARGNVFLDRLQVLLEERGVIVERFRKPTFTKPAPLDLRQKIATTCDAVVEALAD